MIKRMSKIIAKILIVSLLLNCNGMCVLAETLDDIEIVSQKTDPTEYIGEEEIETEPEVEQESEQENEEAIEEDLEEETIEEIDNDLEESEIASDSEFEEEVLDDAEEEIEEETNVASENETDNIEESFVSEKELEEDEISMSLFGGTKNVDETINLVFGNAPKFDKSINWASAIDAIGRFTYDTTNNSYSITGPVGASISNTFSGTSAPWRTIGMKDHIELPDYDRGDSTVWKGYKFVGWKDNYGNNLSNTFFYSYQYEKDGQPSTNDIDYIPQWNLLPDTQTATVRFWRSTASTATTTNAYKFSETTKTVNHGEYLLIEPENVQGYKPTSYIIKDETGNVVLDAGIVGRGLKEIDTYGEYYEKDPSTDLRFATDFILKGSMPNHDISIELFYEPDPSAKFDLTIYYRSELGNDIKSPVVVSYAAEDIVTVTTASILYYFYDRATVSCSALTTNHMYGLGTFYLPGEILQPANRFTGPVSEQGKFYAKMPNQDVTIVYTYGCHGPFQDITVSIGTESRIGMVSTMSYIISTTRVSGTYSPGQDLIIKNYESEGYAPPAIDVQSVAIESYSGYSSSPISDGLLKYRLDESGIHEINITYYCDPNKTYWSKVSFKAKPVADGGHGTIVEAPRTKSLNDRLFARNREYSVGELIEGIIVTPDAHYETKWYKCNASMNPEGAPLSLTDRMTLTDSSYTFFAAFEKIAADFVNLSYIGATHGALNGETNVDVLKGIEKNKVSSPSVVTDVGYMWEGGTLVDPVNNRYEGGIWLDELNNRMPDIINIATTYHPSIVEYIDEYPGAVKPVSRVSYMPNGFGKVVPLGTYADRQYVLADIFDKVLEIKNGTDALTQGFTDLIPGRAYFLYECLSSVTVTVGDTIASVGTGTTATVSEKFEIHIPTLNGNYTTSSKSITIKKIPNTEYFLFRADQSFVGPFPTNNTLILPIGPDSPYYTVQITSSRGYDLMLNETIDHESVVFLESHDLTERDYRVVVLGSSVGVSGKTGTNVNAGAGTGKVYKAKAGERIILEGALGKEWEVISNNATLSNTSSIRSEFVMPSEDVVVRNFDAIDTSTTHYSIEVINGNNEMGLADKEAYASFLQTNDPNANAKAAAGYNVKHYVVLNKTRKYTYWQGENDLYNYSLDVGMTIQGKPYPYTYTVPLDESMLNAYIIYEKNWLGNGGFYFASDSVTVSTTMPYDESDDKLKGLGIVSLKSPKALKFTKLQKVLVTSNMDMTYEKAFYVKFGDPLNTATNYTSDLAPKLSNYWSPATITPGNSTFNHKEYLFSGIKNKSSGAVFDATRSAITRDISVEYSHVINQEREDVKLLLDNEITNANIKKSKLKDLNAIATLSDAIDVANNVKFNQRLMSVEQIKQAYLTLKQKVADAKGFAITISIDANGGNSSVRSIEAVDDYAALDTITVEKPGYTFVEWNTRADGRGVKYTSAMTIDVANYPAVLYAIWRENYIPPKPINTGGNGGSGGGGGGGGGGARRYSDESVLQRTIVNVATSSNPINGSFYFKDKEFFESYLDYDPKTKTYTLLVRNMETGENIKDKWVTIEKNIQGISVKNFYRFDSDGKAKVGFYTENGAVYWFSRNEGDEYASLQLGWIYDPIFKAYYFSNSHTGALCTGWTSIEGKDYYFLDTKHTNALGKLDINDTTAASGYGKLLVNAVTPDGYKVDENGARIVEKPMPSK